MTLIIAVLVLYAVMFAICIVFGFYFYSAVDTQFRRLPPFIPVSKEVIQTLPSVLKLKEGSVFYDLGSGDGRVVFALAKAYPQNLCIGVERGMFEYVLANLRRRIYPLSNARFIRGNFFTVNVQDATHVYLYLLPRTVQQLMPKLIAELKPGTVVVSCDFAYRAREADETVVINGGRRRHTLFVYRL